MFDSKEQFFPPVSSLVSTQLDMWSVYCHALIVSLFSSLAGCRQGKDCLLQGPESIKAMETVCPSTACLGRWGGVC